MLPFAPKLFWSFLGELPSSWHRFQNYRRTELLHRDGQTGQGAALSASPLQNVPGLLFARCLVLFCYIMRFCFPDLSETFSFVLTGEDGSRRFGYCRRLLVSTLLLVRQGSGQCWVWGFAVCHKRRGRKRDRFISRVKKDLGVHHNLTGRKELELHLL